MKSVNQEEHFNIILRRNYYEYRITRERERENLEIRGLRADKIWDYENGWFWFSAPSRMSKIIAHYELYKRCINLPGCCIEFGVYKGNSLFQIATFRQMLELPEARSIYAFDGFGAFPVQGIMDTEDQKFITKFSSEGGNATNLSDMYNLLKHKGFKNIFLIEGDVRETFPEFLSENQHVRFNFVHLDMDVYEPTLCVLDKLYEKLVKGGIIMFDDYNIVSGATKAIDEFLSEHENLKLEKLHFSHVPAFIVKP